MMLKKNPEGTDEQTGMLRKKDQVNLVIHCKCCFSTAFEIPEIADGAAFLNRSGEEF